MVDYKGKRYYTRKETAEKLGITTRSLYNRQDTAKVEPLKAEFGRLMINLYTKEDIAKMRAVVAWREKSK